MMDETMDFGAFTESRLVGEPGDFRAFCKARLAGYHAYLENNKPGADPESTATYHEIALRADTLRLVITDYYKNRESEE